MEKPVRDNITQLILAEIDMDMTVSVMDPYRIWAPQLVAYGFGPALPPGAVRFEAEIEYVNPTCDLFDWQIGEAGRAVSFNLKKQIHKERGEKAKLLYLTEKPYLAVTSRLIENERQWAIRITAVAFTFPVGNYTVTKGASNETE